MGLSNRIGRVIIGAVVGGLVGLFLAVVITVVIGIRTASSPALSSACTATQSVPLSTITSIEGLSGGGSVIGSGELRVCSVRRSYAWITRLGLGGGLVIGGVIAGWVLPRRRPPGGTGWPGPAQPWSPR
jgi:hypothetical protein